MKTITLLLAACSMGICDSPAQVAKSPLLHEASAPQKPEKDPKTVQSVHAGDYLASHFAQQMHDWDNATKFIDHLRESGIEQPDILRRAMVLSMGSGHPAKALALAKEIISQENDGNISIAQMFLITEAFHDENYKKALELIDAMPEDSTAKFVKPYAHAWAEAGLGKIDISALRENTMQIYHAILISDYLDDHKEISKILDSALQVEDISASELERIADVFAHIGMKDKALGIYNRILKEWPEDTQINDKISDLQNGTNTPLFQQVKTPRIGMARAFFDIAQTLYQEYNDDSARIFAQLSLYLAPDMTESKLIMAHISGRHHQYDDAVAYYKGIPEDHEEYLNARYKIADIYEDSGRINQALDILQDLAVHHNDIEARIRIGDIHRRQGEYGQALEAYNTADKTLGGKIPSDYWHLLYVRGMVYEQIGEWDKAEADLKEALNYRPDHPFILNYLGYAWADQGIHLKEALNMIQRAVDLRPTDGFIVDSLGWVKYRMGDYKGATPILEQAVALMPYDPTINDHLGDAYWQVGRKMEARFQWKRAKNHTDDPKIIEELQQKLVSGLKAADPVQEARNKK